MKRLTEYTIPETGFTVVPEEKYKRILIDEKPSVEKVYNRLKKIEDILGDEYDLDRLRELLEACKGLEPSEIAESKLLIATRKDPEKLARMAELGEADREGRCIVLPCKKGDTVWRIVHDAAPHITKDRCTDIKYENRDIWVHLIGDRVMGGWNFGKLLFLTREDAEAALRREQE